MATTRRAATTVEAIRHADTRPNIPTEELRDFVDAAETAPPVMRYPRDPSLDPQLVWRGKDEQDAADLEVPVVPIYIQEKIQPRAIIDNLARTTPESGQLDLFADFGDADLDLGEKVEFYQHEQPWSNRMILGDSLLVMTSLAEKEGLKGKVQTIYLDPPYGIKFGSNWQVSTRKRDVKDGSATDVTRQPEQVKAFRDTWELGIHSYLAYLRDRLVAGRELLAESGSIFVQIGEENVHLVRTLLDETFGRENFVSQIVYVTTSTQGGDLLPTVNDNILWYCRDLALVKNRSLFVEKEIGGAGSSGYNFIELGDGTERRALPEEVLGVRTLPQGAKFFAASDLTSSHYSLSEPIEINGSTYGPGHRYWSTSTVGMYRLRDAARIIVSGNTLRFRRYLDDFPVFPRTNLWPDTGIAGFTADRKSYVVQTNQKVVERCILMTTDPGDLVLDPTCGSGTTAYVAEQWGRRWITIDTSRVALALARTRLMAAKYPYYLLADSPEGAIKEAELASQAAFSATPPPPQQATLSMASSTNASRISRSNPLPTTPTSKRA